MRWSKYLSDPKRYFASTSTFVLDQKEIENLDAVYTGGEHRREGGSGRVCDAVGGGGHQPPAWAQPGGHHQRHYADLAGADWPEPQGARRQRR